eukprot:1160614-Pelagomonas_calceolata.AAC.13
MLWGKWAGSQRLPAALGGAAAGDRGDADLHGVLLIGRMDAHWCMLLLLVWRLGTCCALVQGYMHACGCTAASSFLSMCLCEALADMRAKRTIFTGCAMQPLLTHPNRPPTLLYSFKPPSIRTSNHPAGQWCTSPLTDPLHCTCVPLLVHSQPMIPMCGHSCADTHARASACVQPIKDTEAKERGLIDQVVSKEELLQAAKKVRGCQVP